MRLTAQASCGLGRADELYDRFITDQRLSCPVASDTAEQTMLNPIPLRSARWIVCHRDGQVEFIGELLQAPFPQPTPIAIGTTAIGLNQQLVLAAIAQPTHRQPPQANGGHGERRGFMRSPHHDIARVAPEIINAIGDCFAFGIGRKVGFENVQRFTAPGASGIFESADRFLFLRI